MRGRLVAILLGVVMIIGGVYGTYIIHREKEHAAGRRAALHDNLAAMRKAIANFHAEQGRYPRSLGELVPRYLPRIPADPITGSHTTWRVTTEETVQPSADFTTAAQAKSETYIIDVHSGAAGQDAEGVPFADY